MEAADVALSVIGDEHVPRIKIGENDNPGDGPVSVAIDTYGHMRLLDEWWQEARHRLDWQPIATYEKVEGDLPLFEPVVLRSPFRWVYGCWHEGRWMKVTEGGSYALDSFVPVQWAEPTLNDAILLAWE